MKKTLVSALAAAFVIGTASTTLAAANPFSDVPRDHWAYDAVTQLAADGIIEGYGDGTYRGDRNITRYEMAQMTAKAMAKGDMSASDRALVDRLAAEFADELQNLGVRVSNLERNADMVKWNGKLEYTYTSQRGTMLTPERRDRIGQRANDDGLVFRLEPTAEVSDHWSVHARLDARTDMKRDAGDDGTVTLKRAWAQGDYGDLALKFGKIELLSGEGYQPPGAIVLDREFSGAEVSYGSDLKFVLQAGRMKLDDTFTSRVYDIHRVVEYIAPGSAYYRPKDTANYQRVGIRYDKAKWTAGVDYYRLSSDDFRHGLTMNEEETMGIWGFDLAYRFDKNSVLSAAYARSPMMNEWYYFGNSSLRNYSYQVTYAYKGANPEDKGSWGAYASYRSLGGASVAATQDGALFGAKGIEIGTNYTFARNVVFSAKYFRGNYIDRPFYVGFLRDDDGKAAQISQLFARVEFLF